MLVIKSVSKSFDSKRVLSSISVSIVQGKCHVFLGSSGSGKSTLLKIIMGLLRADSGTIELGGETFGFGDPRTRATWLRRIGYVPQNGGLFPHLTARKNVSLVAETLGWKKTKISSRIDKLIEIFSLDEDLLSRFPHELSGGQKQRIAVMRAVFLNPSVVLLDEPFGALDPIVRADVQHRLREIFQRLKKTVILVTHDISEAVFFGDGVTLLKDGCVLQSGRMEELVRAPSDPYVTQFISAQRSWEHLLTDGVPK